ncbi:hypothetical protein SAMN05421797_101448 [Maribacter ulvicola]|uniref:Uncharacterized protein n=1 Tax=Maribacter ulvicola TaxID=228959 RepID=A0A1N6PH87_9FLAO|nr:hypothetical protein SAMN05421797_101448 [Maribacter ulvicola]
MMFEINIQNPLDYDFISTKMKFTTSILITTMKLVLS